MKDVGIKTSEASICSCVALTKNSTGACSPSSSLFKANMILNSEKSQSCGDVSASKSFDSLLSRSYPGTFSQVELCLDAALMPRTFAYVRV